LQAGADTPEREQQTRSGHSRDHAMPLFVVHAQRVGVSGLSFARPAWWYCRHAPLLTSPGVRVADLTHQLASIKLERIQWLHLR